MCLGAVQVGSTVLVWTCAIFLAKRDKCIFTFFNSMIYPRDTHAPIHLSLSVPSPPSSALPVVQFASTDETRSHFPRLMGHGALGMLSLQHLWITIPTPAALPLPCLGSVLRIFLPGGLHQPHNEAPCLWGSPLSYGSQPRR